MISPAARNPPAGFFWTPRKPSAPVFATALTASTETDTRYPPRAGRSRPVRTSPAPSSRGPSTSNTRWAAVTTPSPLGWSTMEIEAATPYASRPSDIPLTVQALSPTGRSEDCTVGLSRCSSAQPVRATRIRTSVSATLIGAPGMKLTGNGNAITARTAAAVGLVTSNASPSTPTTANAGIGLRTPSAPRTAADNSTASQPAAALAARTSRPPNAARVPTISRHPRRGANPLGALPPPACGANPVSRSAHRAPCSSSGTRHRGPRRGRPQQCRRRKP